jgi:CNT family concentrative nucleoside transporter
LGTTGAPRSTGRLGRFGIWLGGRRWQLASLGATALLGGLAWLLREGLTPRGVAGLGALCFLGLCFAASRDPRKVNPRTVLGGLGLQLVLAVMVLKTDLGQQAFGALGAGIRRFLEFTDEGSRFVFGALADPAAMQSAFGPGRGFVFAFRALPTIIFVSAFFSVLYFLRVLPWVVRGMARVMRGAMRVSGAESLSAAANVFMGQTEAPLIVKPYVERMTESELMALMIGGFATISGGVMAVYIDLGASAPALLTASVMAAPAALVVAKILVPEDGQPETAGVLRVETPREAQNVLDALSHGAAEGMKLALNVAAMLIAFLAAIALLDYLLSLAGTSLAGIFGVLFAPLAFLAGAPPGDVPAVADLLGTKLVANEFVAYLKLTGEYATSLSPRGALVATIALCGFANLGSIGIQIGGIGGIAPGRRGDLARLGLTALYGGFLATLLNAAVAGGLFG